MADKVNMALDEIIKMNKQDKKKTFSTKGKQGGGKKVTRVVNRSRTQAAKKIVKKAVGRARQQPAARNNKNMTAQQVMNNPVTKKLVQNLVKKALKNSRVVASPRAAGRPVIRRGAVPRNISTAQLGGIAARSRGIVRARPAPVVRQRVIQQQPRVIAARGRGFPARQQRQPIQYVEEVVQQPIIRQRVIRQPIVMQQAPRLRSAPRQQVVVQRVVQQQAPRQRVIQQRQRMQPRQQVIQRVQPRAVQKRVIMVQQQQPVQRIRQPIQRQRVQVVRQQQRPQQQIQYVEVPARQARQRQQQQVVQYVQAQPRQNRKAQQFRDAIQAAPGRRQQQAARFEPVTSYVRTSGAVQRGRGFRGF